MKKVVLLAFVLVLLLPLTVVIHFSVPVEAETKTIYVDASNVGDPLEDGSLDHPFDKIQEGIDAAVPGDTVFAYSGIYYEWYVVLDKDNLSLVGENKGNTVIDGMNYGWILIITGQKVTVTGFTIQNSPGATGGVFLNHATKSKISNNLIKNHDSGIYSVFSNGNVIENNRVSDSYAGIILSEYCRDNRISNNEVVGNTRGIDLTHHAHHNEIRNNKIFQNIYGVSISRDNNSIFGNEIVNNNVGIFEDLLFGRAQGYRIFHNNFINNTKQIDLDEQSINIWDNGLEGNYWNNYTGVDSNHDGIGDSHHVINANNTDQYPLMGMFHSFDTIPELHVNVISNSSIRDFRYFKANSTIKMRGSNMTANQTFGFCRVCIPHALMYEPYNVTIDGANPVKSWNYALYDNWTHRWIYFVYQHSTHEIIIQGSDTAPPIISIISPEKKTYPLNEVPLNFTVDEPTDWMGYSLDGQKNEKIDGNTTLTSLFDGLHHVVVYANDTAGNMGYSETGYFTVDTVPPNIEILSPENKTYASSLVFLTFTVDEVTSWIGYSLDGQMNVTINGNTALVFLSDGGHTITVFANDTVGNMGFSDIVYFTIQTFPIDTTPPSISIMSPMNKTYATTDIPLTFTVDESVSWMAYSLDSKANVTIAGNTTLSELSEGLHSLIVYAKDTAGNTGASEIIYFGIKTQEAEPFPTWIIAVIVIIALVGAALLIYFVKFKKTTEKVE